MYFSNRYGNEDVANFFKTFLTSRRLYQNFEDLQTHLGSISNKYYAYVQEAQSQQDKEYLSRDFRKEAILDIENIKFKIKSTSFSLCVSGKYNCIFVTCPMKIIDEIT